RGLDRRVDPRGRRRRRAPRRAARRRRARRRARPRPRRRAAAGHARVAGCRSGGALRMERHSGPHGRPLPFARHGRARQRLAELPPMITVLAGGVGAARFLRGLIDVVDPATITAIVNTGDDTTLHGLRISPDLDTVTYTLPDAIDPARGWGLVDETWRAMESLARYTPHRPQGSTAGGTWFNLGDQDLATHLYRTA